MADSFEDELQTLMGQWLAVFWSHSESAPEAKLQEEVDEFLAADHRTLHKLEEAADVMIVVMAEVLAEGFTLPALSLTLRNKLNINIARRSLLQNGRAF